MRLYNAIFLADDSVVAVLHADKYRGGRSNGIFPEVTYIFDAVLSEEELCRQTGSFDEERYREACQSFMERIDMKEEGCGAKTLADIIVEKAVAVV